jgi:hypothetical protein
MARCDVSTILCSGFCIFGVLEGVANYLIYIYIYPSTRVGMADKKLKLPDLEHEDANN